MKLPRLFKPNVEKLIKSRNVDGLAKALADPETEIREGAARGLGELAFPRVVPPLCTALQDKEWTVLLTVIDALTTLGDARAIPHLATVLGDKRPAVPKAAAEALVKFGKPSVPHLLPLLTADDPVVRLHAVDILGQINDPTVLVKVYPLLTDAEWTVRETTALVLGSLGDKNAIDPLSALLMDSNPKVVSAATQALQKIGLPTDPLSQARFAIAKGDFTRAAAIGAPAVEILIATLSHATPDIRRDAARALGHIADARALEPLAKSLGDEDWGVREAAAWSIARLDSPRVIEQLASCLKARSAAVREAAAKAFSQLTHPDPTAIGPLVAALHDEEYLVGESAAAALATLGPVAVEPLLTAYKDSNSAVRRAIATALEKTGVPNEPSMQAWMAIMQNDWTKAIQLGDLAIEPLIIALKDDDHRVRRAAAETLGQIAQIGAIRAIEPLCHALRDRKVDVRKTIADVLVTIGQPAVDCLVATLNDLEWQARESAASVLGQIGDQWSIGPLCDAMHDPDGRVAEAAAEALDAIGLPEDPEVEAWHAVAKKDWPRAVGLGTNAFEPLCIALNNPVPDVRWAATRALGQIGDPRGVGPLRTMMRDDEAYVRDAASDALAKLGYVEDPGLPPQGPPIETPEQRPAEESAAE